LEFFNDELNAYVTNQSIKYAKHNCHEFALKTFQLQCIIGFLLFTGYHKLLKEDMYWENAKDSSVQNVQIHCLGRHTETLSETFI